MPTWITELFSNFWVSLSGKLTLVALMIPLIGMAIGFAEMKLSAKMQARVGPYFAGGRWGWAQLIADGIKFFQKEDVIPANADRPVFKAAPILVLVGTDMPAILAEVSCLSHREEVELLRTDAYRQRIAEALFEGIDSYARGLSGPGVRGS